MELILNQVTKQYPGTVAVDRISADLRPGVIGLLGSNGAGKTTLMRMICGIIKPTSGTICFRNGNDTLNASDEMYRDALGYLPQDFGYYPNFTGREFLMYMAALKGIDKGTAKRKCEELLKIVSLEKAANKKTNEFKVYPQAGSTANLGCQMQNPEFKVIPPSNGQQPALERKE